MTGRIGVGSARVPFALALCMLFTPCNWSHAKQQVTLAHGTVFLDSADAFSVLDITTAETSSSYYSMSIFMISPAFDRR
nr:PREDICTED: uncharacterized protein LOC109039272 [Bemisia tabaci]XP_018910224.1 PREDICTED: uncharacterized protein LOC109039272 [Bemisia tabaci]